MALLVPPDGRRRAQRFALAASVVASEASRLAKARLPRGDAADAAGRAAAQAQLAVAALDALAQRGDASLDEVMEVAAWALLCAAVAIGQDNPAAEGAAPAAE